MGRFGEYPSGMRECEKGCGFATNDREFYWNHFYSCAYGEDEPAPGDERTHKLTDALIIAYELHGLEEQIRRHMTADPIALPNRGWMRSAVRTILDAGMVEMP